MKTLDANGLRITGTDFTVTPIPQPPPTANAVLGTPDEYIVPQFTYYKVRGGERFYEDSPEMLFRKGNFMVESPTYTIWVGGIPSRGNPGPTGVGTPEFQEKLPTGEWPPLLYLISKP